jgi:hypothetical protein
VSYSFSSLVWRPKKTTAGLWDERAAHAYPEHDNKRADSWLMDFNSSDRNARRETLTAITKIDDQSADPMMTPPTKSVIINQFSLRHSIPTAGNFHVHSNVASREVIFLKPLSPKSDVNLELEAHGFERFFRCPACQAVHVVANKKNLYGIPQLVVSHLKM